MSKYNLGAEDVLDNKLGLTDPEELKAVEAAICHVRMIELSMTPVDGFFDFAHLKEIHRRLFADLYFFAGAARDVDLARGTSRFCQAVFIEVAQEEIFSKLKHENYLRGLDTQSFVERLAYYSGELNALHPFREGNGRALRIFLQQLSAHAGYDLPYFEANEEALLEADIAAFFGELRPLVTILSQIVRPNSDD